MNSIKELEEKLKQEATKKKLLETISDYLIIGLKELEKNITKLLSTPTKKYLKNQITKQLDIWEEKIRKNY